MTYPKPYEVLADIPWNGFDKMEKLTILLCENFYAEFLKALEGEGFPHVYMEPFPCMCEDRERRTKAREILNRLMGEDGDIYILCSRHCDMVNLVPEDSPIKIRISDHCLSHTVDDALFEYVESKGGHIVTREWLERWEENVVKGELNKEHVKELVFFDTGINPLSLIKLKALSEFLQLPHVVIPWGIESVAVVLRGIFYEWKLEKNQLKHEKSMNDALSQQAEYSAILDVISKITSETNRRDLVDKIKEIFVMIFGAQNFKYWANLQNGQGFSQPVEQLFVEGEKRYLILEDKSVFYLSIQHKDTVYGVIEVGDFLFPEYVDRYLNLSIEIARVCGLVLSNISQFEKLAESEQKLKHLSYHDSLTGVYNLRYVEEVVKKEQGNEFQGAFMFDLDNLKTTNDTLGHLKGDELINRLADIIKSNFRQGDIIARIGGDEFIVLLPEGDPQLLEMIKKRIELAVWGSNLEDEHLKVAVSMGYAVKNHEGDTLTDLINRADVSMYINKRSKRTNTI